MCGTRVAGILAGCALCMACDRIDSAPATVVRDSMGVMLVESTRASWSEGGVAWRIDSVPRLRVGVQEGPEEYQFFGLRDAVVLETGTIIVANDGSSELRWFDSTGAFLKAVGRRGEGPGEFGEFSTLEMCLDAERMLVRDNGNDRVNVFAITGQYESTFRLQPAGGGRPVGIAGCIGAGKLLGVSYPSGGVLRGEPGDVLETEMDYVAVGNAGTAVSTIAKVRGRPRFVNEVEGAIHYPYIPLTPEPLLVASPEGAFVSVRGGAAAVEKRTHDGEVVAIFRWSAPARQPVKRVWDEYVRESLDAITNEVQRKRYARLYLQHLPLPDSTPAFQSLELDTEGNLWAQRYRLPGGTRRHWDIINPDGVWLGTVTMPEALEVIRIGADYVIGRERDELGVERLVIYEVVKP